MFVVLALKLNALNYLFFLPIVRTFFVHLKSPPGRYVRYFLRSLRKHFYAIDNCHQALLASFVSFKPSPNALAPL